MAPRIIKLREKGDAGSDVEPAPLSQSRRPELGRFLLQVDRQTKSSHETLEAAEAAGRVGEVDLIYIDPPYNSRQYVA